MNNHYSKLNYAVSAFTSLLLATGLTFYTSMASAEVSTKDLAVVQRPIANLEPPPQEIAAPSRPAKPRRGLHVTAWVNHQDNTYAIGDSVNLYVKANQDAYLTILNVGTSGKTHIVFPNRYQRNNHVRAGQTVQIPGSQANFDFQVQGPPGAELIKVIASTKPGVLFKENQVKPAGPYKELKALAPGVAKDLQVVLRQDHQGAWTAYNKVIRIVAPW